MLFLTLSFPSFSASDTIPIPSKKTSCGIGVLWSGFGMQWRDSVGTDEFHYIRGNELTSYLYFSIKNFDIGPALSYSWHKSDVAIVPPPIRGYGFFMRYRFRKRKIRIYHSPFVSMLSLWKDGYIANNTLENYRKSHNNFTLTGLGSSFKIWKFFYLNLSANYAVNYYYDTKQFNFKNRLYGTLQFDFRF